MKPRAEPGSERESHLSWPAGGWEVREEKRKEIVGRQDKTQTKGERRHKCDEFNAAAAVYKHMGSEKKRVEKKCSVHNNVWHEGNLILVKPN